MDSSFFIPEPKDFSICALRVFPDCAHCKILHEGVFFFNDNLILDHDDNWRINESSKVSRDFFGSNITIQAIVGENGSGKSSLLELMYRLINNFGFMLELGMHKNSNSMQLCYVQGLKLSLVFLINNRIGELSVWDDTMQFRYDDYSQRLSFRRITNADKPHVYVDFLDVNEDVVREATVTAPVARMAEVARRFFYTIVTNYSIQSCVDDDFAEEKTLIEFRPELELGENGKKQISRKVIEREGGDVWIHGIFHKNDGYRTPIVLNPYRKSGVIDMNREFRLAVYRLSAIFLKAKLLKIQLLEDYDFSDVQYNYDQNAVELKFDKLFYRTVDHQSEWIQFLDIEREVLSKPNSIAYKILKMLGLSQRTDLKEPIVRDSCLYMIYKTLAIASKYPSYYYFESFGDIKSYFQETDDIRTDEKLSLLLSTIEKDNSHITLKFRQMRNFLKLLERDPEDIKRLSSSFSYDWYINQLRRYGIIRKCPRNMHDILETLPPSIFRIDIMLIEKEKKELVNFRHMSSGERQFLFTCGTFIYHLLNLKSVHEYKRVRYRCMSLVLDEVEICFHPEYQRLFISKLISLLIKLRLNYRCSLNILIATHSPFILSDIPQQNILYLENGKCVNNQIKVNPYAANVNDILHQSFFLKESFIGQFALERLEGLVSSIDSIGKRKNNRSENDLMNEISLIGDKFLKQQLTSYFSFKTNAIRYGKTVD